MTQRNAFIAADSRDLVEWLSLPVVGRPSLEEFRRKRALRRASQGSLRLGPGTEVWSNWLARQQQVSSPRLRPKGIPAYSSLSQVKRKPQKIHRNDAFSYRPLSSTFPSGTKPLLHTGLGSLIAKSRPPVRSISTAPRLAVPVPKAPSSSGFERLQTEFRRASAKDREAAERSAAGFRNWLSNVLGGVVTAIAVGTLRTIWTVVTGWAPFF